MGCAVKTERPFPSTESLNVFNEGTYHLSVAWEESRHRATAVLRISQDRILIEALGPFYNRVAFADWDREMKKVIRSKWPKEWMSLSTHVTPLFLEIERLSRQPVHPTRKKGGPEPVDLAGFTFSPTGLLQEANLEIEKFVVNFRVKSYEATHGF